MYVVQHNFDLERQKSDSVSNHSSHQHNSSADGIDSLLNSCPAELESSQQNSPVLSRQVTANTSGGGNSSRSVSRQLTANSNTSFPRASLVAGCTIEDQEGEEENVAFNLLPTRSATSPRAKEGTEREEPQGGGIARNGNSFVETQSQTTSSERTSSEVAACSATTDHVLFSANRASSRSRLGAAAALAGETILHQNGAPAASSSLAIPEHREQVEQHYGEQHLMQHRPAAHHFHGSNGLVSQHGDSLLYHHTSQLSSGQQTSNSLNWQTSGFQSTYVITREQSDVTGNSNLSGDQEQNLKNCNADEEEDSYENFKAFGNRSDLGAGSCTEQGAINPEVREKAKNYNNTLVEGGNGGSVPRGGMNKHHEQQTSSSSSPQIANYNTTAAAAKTSTFHGTVLSPVLQSRRTTESLLSTPRFGEASPPACRCCCTTSAGSFSTAPTCKLLFSRRGRRVLRV
ncbi:unnamed protein product [Amoebophrya sp. A120]|nr:unnamed protein product [Amoebophrya sp. A120]|eukprot:GSA120T00009826001.1